MSVGVEVRSEVGVEAVPEAGVLVPGMVVSVGSPAGPQRGVWLAREGGCEVLLDDSGVLVRVLPTGPVEVLDPVVGDGLLVGRLAAAVVEQFGQRVEQADAHRRWLGELVEVAHREADYRDWCSDFDDLLEGLGLPRRQHDYEVEVRYSGEVTLSVSAGSAEEAEGLVDEAQVRDAIEAAVTSRSLAIDIDSTDAS